MSTQADLLAAAEAVMADLEEYGSSIVPHLIDTDENDGQRLRDAIAAVKAEVEAQETASDGTVLYKQLAAEPVSANETHEVMGVMFKLPELGVGVIISDPVSLVRIGNLSNGVGVAIGKAQAGPKSGLHLPGDPGFNQPPSTRRN